MKRISGLLILLSLMACTGEKSKSSNLKSDTFFHYSIWWAFVNKVFDADLSVKDLKSRGDTGLGSFNFLDGEMVMINGIAYRIRQNGEVSVGDDSDKIVYANGAFYQPEFSFKISQPDLGQDSLKSEITRKLPSPNYFYVMIITGKFKKIKLGGLHKQDRPFKEGLDILIPNRPVFEAEDISGTIVGFYCPDFIGNINAKGYHFHFISDDKKYGGHVMELLVADELTVGIDKKTDYHFYLPDNEDFAKVGFDKQFQYKKD